MPTPSRDTPSIAKLFANPASAVIADQPRMEMLNSLVRTHPSASRPSGSEKIA